MNEIQLQIAENEKFLVQPDYICRMEKLSTEWPQEKLQKFILDYLRESCVWALERQNGIEIENAEQRRLGVSYDERKRTSGQIEALHGLFLKWKHRGLKYKEKPPALSEIVHPEDLLAIDALGFEAHLMSALLL